MEPVVEQAMFINPAIRMWTDAAMPLHSAGMSKVIKPASSIFSIYLDVQDEETHGRQEVNRGPSS